MDPIGRIAIPTVYSLGNGVVRDVDEKTALKAFEAYFIGEMLRQSAPKEKGGLFDGGQAGRMYQEHLYQEFARLIAEQGDFGFASSLEGTLLRKEAMKETEIVDDSESPKNGDEE